MHLPKREARSGRHRTRASECLDHTDNRDTRSELTERQAAWLSRRRAVSLPLVRTVASVASLAFQGRPV